MWTISKNKDVTRQDGGEITGGRIAGFVALSSIFAKWVNLQWGIVAYERGWYPETDPSVLGIRWLSASSCSDSGSLTMETAIFVTSHLKKWLLSLPRGALELSKSSKSSNIRSTEFTEQVGRRTARGIPAHILLWEQGVLNMTSMANGRHWQPREF